MIIEESSRSGRTERNLTFMNWGFVYENEWDSNDSATECEEDC